jgi:hypothetical protein
MGVVRGVVALQKIEASLFVVAMIVEARKVRPLSRSLAFSPAANRECK